MTYFNYYLNVVLGVVIDFSQRVYSVNEDEQAVVKVLVTSGVIVSPVTVR